MCVCLSVRMYVCMYVWVCVCVHVPICLFPVGSIIGRNCYGVWARYEGRGEKIILANVGDRTGLDRVVVESKF